MRPIFNEGKANAALPQPTSSVTTLRKGIKSFAENKS